MFFHEPGVKFLSIANLFQKSLHFALNTPTSPYPWGQPGLSAQLPSHHESLPGDLMGSSVTFPLTELKLLSAEIEKKMWCLYATECYATAEKDRVELLVRKWMQLDTMTLNEVSQTRHLDRRMVALTWEAQSKNKLEKKTKCIWKKQGKRSFTNGKGPRAGGRSCTGSHMCYVPVPLPHSEPSCSADVY